MTAQERLQFAQVKTGATDAEVYAGFLWEEIR